MRNKTSKTIPFAIMPRTKKPLIKYLGITLTKDAQNLYSESYEILLRELKKKSK